MRGLQLKRQERTICLSLSLSLLFYFTLFYFLLYILFKKFILYHTYNLSLRDTLLSHERRYMQNNILYFFMTSIDVIGLEK